MEWKGPTSLTLVTPQTGENRPTPQGVAERFSFQDHDIGPVRSTSTERSGPAVIRYLACDAAKLTSAE